MSELDEPTIGLAAAARFLKMSTAALKDKARTGEISAHRIGRRCVFIKSLLMEFALSQGGDNLTVHDERSLLSQLARMKNEPSVMAKSREALRRRRKQ